VADTRLYKRLSDRWQEDGVGTTAGVTVTRADPGDDKALVCTSIQCSGDAAALVTIESPAATILYRKRFAAAFTLSETFPPGVMQGPESEALLVKISASTANCEANFQGYTVHVP
jgi:hypothetical protein